MAAPKPHNIDLDAARAERQKQAGDPPTVTIGGKTLELPLELPVDFLEYVAVERFDLAMGTLFDGEDLEHFRAQRLTVPDLELFADGIADAYGLPGGFGKLAGLWRLLLEHFEPLEADLLATYGLDLGAELWRPSGTINLRRLINLVRHLPPSAHIWRELGVGHGPAWSTTDELLHSTIQLLDVIARKGTKVRKPLITIRRPFDPKEKPEALPTRSLEAQAFFGGAVQYEPRQDSTA